MAEHWIKSAIRHPGSFSAVAKKAGKSTAEYDKIHQHDSGTLGRRARLAKTLMKMADGGVVNTAPVQQTKLSRLYDILFGRKALQEAGKTGDPQPSAPPQPQTDISAVKQAAQEAAERLKKRREEGSETRSFKCGGVVMGRYGK